MTSNFVNNYQMLNWTKIWKQLYIYNVSKYTEYIFKCFYKEK